jgi:hypothetical protein
MDEFLSCPFHGGFPLRTLPTPDEMNVFWARCFPPLCLLSKSVVNHDAYWRRLQRILSHIADEAEVPCPFTKTSRFFEALIVICRGLDGNSLSQIIQCLERMPHASDPQVILWDLPRVLRSPWLYLNFLDRIRRDKHWLWTTLLNSLGGSDLLLDRFFCYLDPFPVVATWRELESRLIAIEVFCHVFIARPPADDRFFESFDKVFRKLLSVIEGPSRADLVIHCFRCAVNILESVKHKFPETAYLEYWTCLVCSGSKQHFLRQIVLRLRPSIAFCDLSMVKLGKVILQNCPDPPSIWSIANVTSMCKTA